MKKAIILGGVGGLVAYMAYSYVRQRKSWAPAMVPLGNLIGGGLDPMFYGTIGVGALLGYALR